MKSLDRQVCSAESQTTNFSPRDGHDEIRPGLWVIIISEILYLLTAGLDGVEWNRFAG